MILNTLTIFTPFLNNLLLFLFVPIFLWGQDTVKMKKVKILPVPAFGHSPETRTYIGAVSLFTFDFYQDSTTRHSNAKIEFNYTWNRQIIIECGWNFFSKDENWFTKGQIHSSKFPDYYYGIGSNTPDSNKFAYQSNRFIFDISTFKKIKPYLFTGVTLKYIQYWNVSPINATSLNYLELTNNVTLGLGYSLLKDNRNSILSPTSGTYIYVNSTYNFSKSNYWKFLLDLRYYKTWNEKFTIAGRFVNDISTNTPPFYDYAFLGGDKFVRGYYYGRYRDKNLSCLQLEFRLPIVWRIGMATFGGISNVYPDASNIKMTNTKYNTGLGIRFMVDKKDKTNLRLDYAIGNNKNNGFYVSFGESF
ncbi:MAG: BamA/TamA family outer membrane protein [Bacteroidia bacterium]|nr:BamA/TamA family outer membrane protein [Bacteroidia bacterium]